LHQYYGLLKRFLHNCFLLVLFLLTLIAANAQPVVNGRVYDITQRTPMQGVTVLSTSGRGAITDSTGYYSIEAQEKDSIWFSYLGKATPKYAVKTILLPGNFDIAIQRKVVNLKEVTVRKNSYREDSAQYRKEYASIFNYRKPGFRVTTISPSVGGVGAGLDLNELINMFRFKRNRQLLTFQRRILQDERDRYVEYRFSRSFVTKLTKLSGAALDSFMTIYRPPYQFVQQANEAELGIYILDCFRRYKNRDPFRPRKEPRLSEVPLH
jgi:CarboxypepD_reg-like domain